MRLATAPVSELRFESIEVDSPLGCWSWAAAFPSGPLAEVVEMFWVADLHGADARSIILPRSSTEVLFTLGEPGQLFGNDGSVETFETSWISGLQQRPLDVESDGQAGMAAIRLQPQGVLPYLGLPPTEIRGHVVALSELLGPSADDLRDRLLAEPTLRGRLLLLVDDVERRLAAGHAVRGEVRHAIAAIERSQGRVAIRDLVRESGFSHRYFSRRFQEDVGLAPKAFARIVRFVATVENLRRPRPASWADVAVDRGYFDQAHLVRDFRELAGVTPTELSRRLAPDDFSLVSEEPLLATPAPAPPAPAE